MNDTPVQNVQSTALVESGRMSARDLIVTPSGIYFGNAQEMRAWAHQMSSSGNAIAEGFRNNLPACLMVVDDAVRFRMSPTALIRSAYVVNGRIAYEGKVMGAILRSTEAIKGRPKYEFKGEGVNMVCTATVIAADDGEVITYESPPIKEIEPKKSPLWKSDPRQQLRYYTIRALGRAYFPEIMMGVYDPEEAAAYRQEIIDITPQTSGLAERLPGPATTGFSETHVAAELSESPVEASEAPEATTLPEAEETAPTVAPEAPEAVTEAEVVTEDVTVLSKEEAEALEALTKDLKKAKTELEVGGVNNTYAASFAQFSQPAIDEARRRIGARIEALRVQALDKKAKK